MGFFLLLGLVSVGLVVGSLSGGNDDADDSPAPDPDRIIEGTDQADTLSGTGLNDLLFGQPGDDVISGGNGSDIVMGSGGLDSLRGDAGDDFVAGGNGADLVNAGRGDDFVLGGEGDDTLNGNDGNDSIYGISGADSLYGNEGDDILSGIDVPNAWTISAEIEDAISEKLAADHGDDAGPAIVQRVLDQMSSSGPLPTTGSGDSLEGGQGNDTLIGDSGDTLTGGTGADRFVVDAARPDLAFGAADYEPVFITDYDAGTDTIPGEAIMIRVVGDPDAPPALTLRQVATSVEIRLDDAVVAVLTNRVVEAIDESLITVEARPSLESAAGMA